MPKWKHWNKEDLLNLEILYKSNYPIEQIALELGRSENSIRLKCSRLKLKRSGFKISSLSHNKVFYDPIQETIRIAGPIHIEQLFLKILEIQKVIEV